MIKRLLLSKQVHFGHGVCDHMRFVIVGITQLSLYRCIPFFYLFTGYVEALQTI